MAPTQENGRNSSRFTVMDQSSTAGNAPDHVKDHIIGLLQTFFSTSNGFGVAIGSRVEVTEISAVKKVGEPQKMEGRVVCEVTVDEDMANGEGTLHEGCIAYLVDVCSILPMIAYNRTMSSKWKGGTSLTIDIAFHSPAAVGDRLRVVSRTLSVGSRSGSAECEIWNMTQHRLVASGAHINMEPSRPKTKL